MATACATTPLANGSAEQWFTESYPGPLNLVSWAGSNNLFWQNIGR